MHSCPKPMEPRPATRYKENVPPKPVAVLRPELKRPWRNLDSSLDSSLGSGGDWRMLMCQATTPSQGSVFCQKPYQVQSNLASPQPRLALALKDRAGRVGDTGLLQQSNLQLPAGRSRRRTREPFVQHSNLCFRGTPSPRVQNSCLPPTGPSSHRKQTLQVTDTSCLDLRLSGDLAHLDGCIYTDPRPWGSSGSWVPRLVGKPLTLKDLSIPAHSQFQAPPPSSCSTVHWLLDSIQHLEPEATRSGSQASQEYPSPKQRGAHTRDSQSTPAQPWSSHPRASISLLDTLGVQARLSESPVCKPLSREFTLGRLAGDFSDSDQEVLFTQHHEARELGPPGHLYNKRNRGHFSVTRETGIRETKLESPAVFSVLPGQEGRAKALQAKAGRDGKRMTSRPSNTDPAQSTVQQNKAQSIVTPDPQATCRKLLSKSFRAWRHLSQRRQAVAKATALSHRQMIRERLRGLRWILWLREAQLEAAWGQHAKALLAWSFEEWRCVALQQKQKQPHIQAAPMFLASRRSPSLGGKAATDLAWRCRCFRAWQRFMQRGARYRRQLAHQRARTLRTCLGQWMEMKQLQASDVAKVTQLALCRQKAGKEVLSSLAPRTAMACCLATVAQAQPLPRGPDWCSLWEACRKLGLHRVLLLWRMRLYQHQQAISFFQGTRKRALRDILSQWHLRVWGLDPLPSSMKTTLALEPWGSSPGGEAQLGCRTGGSLEKVRVQQTPGAARLYWRSLQRRVLLSWSHWTAAQGAWREQAAHWAWALHCRAVMGLWRQRLAQCQAVQKRVQERGRGLVRTALSRWLSCWQRQQFLCEQYQKWGQVHLQVLQKALFEGWQQAAARRRCLRSYFQAWRECVRGTRMFQDRHQAFPDGLRGDLGSVIANSHEVCRAETLARDRPEASVLAWRSFPQQSGAVRQLRRAQAQQAFVVLRVTLGLCREARQQAGRRAQVLTPVQEVLCWILWTHGAYIGQAHQAHAAQQLTAQVPEVWMQSAVQVHIQRADIIQCWQRFQRFLRIQWAQSWSTLLKQRLELQTQALGMDFRQLASRGRLLLLLDTPNPWMQTHGCWTPVTEDVLPSLAWQLGGGTQRTTSWALSDKVRPLCRTFQFWLPLTAWALSQPPTVELCGSETRALQGQGEAPQRMALALALHLEEVMMFSAHRNRHLQCGHGQASLQARCLARAWQRWVDAHWVEQLSRSLLRQWHLEQAWRTWRKKVLQLRVAQRLHQQEDSWVLSQAFEKWHQRLVSRNPREELAVACAPGNSQQWPKCSRRGVSRTQQQL